MKNKTKIIGLFSVCLLGFFVLLGYLALVYVPPWYEPMYVASEDQQQLRDDFTTISATFNNNMQHPQPFELMIAAKDINRFLSGMAYIDPRLKNALPDSVTDPAVQLEDDYLKIGAIVEQDGKKVFASFWIKIIAYPDWLVLDAVHAKIGLYPVPRNMLRERIDQISTKIASSFPVVDELLQNGQYPNRFAYLNSDYDFKITSMRAFNGILYVNIEPIPGTNQKAKSISKW